MLTYLDDYERLEVTTRYIYIQKKDAVSVNNQTDEENDKTI
jgi:hypothetical protein